MADRPHAQPRHGVQWLIATERKTKRSELICTLRTCASGCQVSIIATLSRHDVEKLDRALGEMANQRGGSVRWVTASVDPGSKADSSKEVAARIEDTMKNPGDLVEAHQMVCELRAEFAAKPER